MPKHFVFASPFKFLGLFDLYVLENRKTREVYTGITSNFLERFAHHHAKRGRDWNLRATYMMHLPYYEATKVERFVKRHAELEFSGNGPKVNNPWLRETLSPEVLQEILGVPDNREEAFVRRLAGVPLPLRV